MWSQIVLCLLVGVAYASNNPAWKTNTEYTYQINGRTLASLNDVSKQYSGIFINAQLRIIVKLSGDLQGRLSDVKYAQVHTHLSEGWNTFIPESDLAYKNLAMSGKHFQMKVEDGIIKDLIVEQGVSNWEANIIKSIASQFQMNTNAKNLEHSKIDVLPENGQNYAVFKTMEDTVTGRTETMYEIRPLPEYILQSEPWLMPKQRLLGDGEVIEVVKHKNYSRAEDRPSYHYGLGDAKDWEPTSNQIEDFFIRSSESRAVLTGKLNRYTIQNSYTVDKIMVSPGLYETQKGSVVSMLNVSLSDVRSKNERSQRLFNPVHLGNLVYTYNIPSASSNEARRKQRQSEFLQQGSDEINSESAYRESERLNRTDIMRFRRSLQEINKDRHENGQDSYVRYKTQQEQPKMTSAPESPLLPFTVGYHGNSIKQDRNFELQQNVRKIAQEIGEELQQPKQILEKGTLSKFVIMTSLIRLMNADELRQTAQALYTQEQGKQRDTWTSFRDAVAQAGTGPAFISIQEWIEYQKIKEEEAADVVSILARSVRTPTEEYMKKFFELIHKRQVKSQEYLNSTSILAFTNLLRQVYVDRKVSHNQFPVHSFGTFNTKEGRTFMKETVIPHLTEKLHEAIAQDDVRKIHLYIRALGNVAHKTILEAFEPYLEGRKQCSQMQRLMMVVAMDKLAATNPVVARTVLYKIYQNSGESQEVRVAAVYQLMRTSPPTDMLQRMASYTNVDPQEHVNAAVKTSIKSLSQLEGKQFQYIRSSARAAEPLLTKEKYGKQHGFNYLCNKLGEDLNIELKQTIQEIGSVNSFSPKSIRYAIRANLGGMKQQILDVRSLVSDVEQLTQVFREQTENYKQQQQQKQEHNSNSQFSSENIARKLNIQREELEKFESSLLMEVASLQRLWSFDNKTIEQIPEVIREYEEILQEGKKIHYSKITNKDMALAFATETGFPFLFTIDMPVLTHVEGTIRAVATPRVSQGDEIKKPETLSANSDMHMTFSTNLQSHLSFVTPFDHQHYIAGTNKNIQIHLPVSGKVDVDIKKMQVKFESNPTEEHSGAQLLHYSQWPFTSRSDIMTIVPVALRPNTHRIREERQHSFDKVIGKQETGMAFRMWGNHPYNSLKILKIGHLLKEYDIVTAVRYMWNILDMQQTEFNLAYVPEQSSTKKTVIRIGHQEKYIPQPQGEFNQTFASLDELSRSKSEDQYARQQAFLNRVSSGIRNVIGKSCDVSVEFKGQREIKHTLTAALGKSNVDSKSNVVIFYENDYENNVEAKPFRMALQVKNEIPNTNGLDLEYTMHSEPKQMTKVQFTYGRFGESDKKIRADAKFERSEERKQYLTRQPLYQQCQREMQEGNKYMQACERMVVKSNLLDRVEIRVTHENMEHEKLNNLKDIFHAVRVYYKPLVQIRHVQQSNQNEIDMKIRYQPDLSAFNVSVKTEDDETLIQNIEMNEWAKQILVPHPVFHLASRVQGKIQGYEETYRPTTVIDQTAAKTFDNKTYPISLGEQWTVLMQYVPRQARRDERRQETVEEQLRRQVENYAIIVRKNQQNPQEKDVMVIVNTPKTQGKDVEIEITPKQQGQSSGSNPRAEIKVNRQEIKYDDKQAYDVADGHIEIYALPNGEVKVEVANAFYIIYDGERVKVTDVNGKLKDSVVGLSGNFDDNKMYELVTPEECVVRDSRKFVESYKLEDKQRTTQLTQEHCRQKVSPLYVNVISDQDAGRNDENDEGTVQKHSESCVKNQTRYVERNDEICFTLRPIPVCKCQQRSTVTKTVEVHCIQKNNVAQLWKTQIDKGASPDFLHKRKTGTVEMRLPYKCDN